MIPIIDLRSSEQFSSGHLPYACHIPFAELENCWHELPQKGSKILLCINSALEANVKQLFEKQKYSIDSIINMDKVENSLLIIDDSNQRLWKANPLLEHYSHLIINNIDNTLDSAPVALDIGCGAGRDSIFLALKGFRLVAIDNSTLALERLNRFYQRWRPQFPRHLTIQEQAVIEPFEFDLQENSEQLTHLIQKKNPDLIIQSRYLHRPLFQIYKKYMKSNSIIAIHTFLQGAAKFGKPRKADFLLKDNELADTFSDWEILLNKVHTLDDGRPLSLFLAKKP